MPEIGVGHSGVTRSSPRPNDGQAFLRTVRPQGQTQPAGAAPETGARTDDEALGGVGSQGVARDPMGGTDTAGIVECEAQAGASDAEGCGMDASGDFEVLERTAASILGAHGMVGDEPGEAATGGGGSTGARAAATRACVTGNAAVDNRRAPRGAGLLAYCVASRTNPASWCRFRDDSTNRRRGVGRSGVTGSGSSMEIPGGSFLLSFFEAGTFGIFVQNLPLWSLSPSFAYSGDDEDSKDPGITSLFFLLEPPEFFHRTQLRKVCVDHCFSERSPENGRIISDNKNARYRDGLCIGCVVGRRRGPKNSLR